MQVLTTEAQFYIDVFTIQINVLIFYRYFAQAVGPKFFTEFA